MTGRSIIPIVIDTDNALGKNPAKILPGDVDDAFAIAFLLKSLSIQSIYSVGGNAPAEICHQNNLAICRVAGSSVRCLPGLNKKSSTWHPVPLIPATCEDYLSLGPLTNLSYFLKHNFSPKRIWMTLGRIKTLGLFPPLWPMEFNVTKDLHAFQLVLEAKATKIIVPLDVAIQLRFRKSMTSQMLLSTVGMHLLSNIKNWQLRNLLLKGRSHFPVWDLVSAMALVHPATCEIKKGTGYLFKNGLFLCDVLNQPRTFHDRRKAIVSLPIEIVTAIDTDLMWKLFFRALQNPSVNLFLPRV